MKDKILIINDNQDVRTITRTILKGKGYETIEASGGEEGVELALNEQPDLILLDIMMPDVNGYETCSRLKAQELTKHIPVIFFTSLNSSQDKIKGLEFGAVDFVNNVVEKGELLARVNTHLSLKKLTEELRKSNLALNQKQKALDDDLKAAASIQKSFLPQKTAFNETLTLSTFWKPANALGGDIFNVLFTAEDQYMIYMLDVSGHDVPSALVTISASQFLQQKAMSLKEPKNPKAIFEGLEQEYPIERFSRYFTLFYALFDPKTSILKFGSAGHPAAILLKNEKVDFLRADGIFIGLNKQVPFEEKEILFEPGDKLFLYTDGISEYESPNGAEYGEERIKQVLERRIDSSPEMLLKAVEQDLQKFSDSKTSYDDMSMMAIERSMKG
ncbi:MAG: fused response regulator/phosphatase [Chlamydiia bacterium]|nr:fused response regulator/phosphatase [Chlamydiia bacterium]